MTRTLMTRDSQLRKRSKATTTRIVALVAASTIVLGACGTGTEPTDGSAQSALTEESSASQNETSTSAADDQTTSSPAETSPEDETGEMPEEETTNSEPLEYNFPDVSVARISDGADVSFAEQLNGGSTPVLLWFWAPH